MDFWGRMMDTRPGSRPAQPPTALNADHIDMGNRLYWVKMAMQWSAERRAELLPRVEAVVNGDAFERNDLERRYTVEGLDERAHSGASLLALVEALHALAASEGDDSP